MCNTFLKILLFGLDTKDLWEGHELRMKSQLSTYLPTYILSLAYCELITYLILRNIYWFIQFDESQFYSTFSVIFFPYKLIAYLSLADEMSQPSAPRYVFSSARYAKTLLKRALYCQTEIVVTRLEFTS